jgi:alginate O-acetyltransferase complex protein AlgJ
MQTTPIRFDSFTGSISLAALMFFSKAVSQFFLIFVGLSGVLALQAADPVGQAATEEQKKAFRAALESGISRAGDGISAPGLDGWIFFDKELRHLAAPRYWSEPDAPVDAATDPLPAILDFQAQLDKAGIELLVVPVPAKAAIYPDKLSASIPPPPATPGDLSEQDAAFLKVLESRGVRVLYLTTDFLKARGEGLETHCRTDTHWSPEGIRIAAAKIAQSISSAPWAQDQGRHPAQSEIAQIPIRGDLAAPDALPETLPARVVKSQAGGGSAGIPDSRQSPVLLLGDSHNLVFHTGAEMHATGAGLPDQLFLELGFPMDVVAVMGSGSTAARRSLARRKDNLAGKKVVVWCFSTREFTQGQGWSKVPVVKDAAANSVLK